MCSNYQAVTRAEMPAPKRPPPADDPPADDPQGDLLGGA
jgi:hypothetical protein